MERSHIYWDTEVFPLVEKIFVLQEVFSYEIYVGVLWVLSFTELLFYDTSQINGQKLLFKRAYSYQLCLFS